MSESLIITSALARSLLHIIRTPLATVQNELAYLDSLVPQGETSCAKESLKKITHFLSSISRLTAASLQLKKLKVEDMLELQNLGFLSHIELTASLKSKNMEVDSELFAKALVIFDKAIGSISSEMQIAINEESKTLEIAWNFKPTQELLKFSGVYKTLSELVCLKLLHDNIELPLAEAIMLAHSCSISIEVSQATTNAKISLPLCC